MSVKNRGILYQDDGRQAKVPPFIRACILYIGSNKALESVSTVAKVPVSREGCVKSSQLFEVIQATKKDKYRLTEVLLYNVDLPMEYLAAFVSKKRGEGEAEAEAEAEAETEAEAEAVEGEEAEDGFLSRVLDPATMGSVLDDVVIAPSLRVFHAANQLIFLYEHVGDKKASDKKIATRRVHFNMHHKTVKAKTLPT